MKKSSFIVGLIILAIVLVAGLILAANVFVPVEDKSEVVIDETVVVGEVEDTEAEKDTSTDLKQLEEQNKSRLSQGCFAGKDCIPSIDNPKFISASQAGYLENDEFVIGLFRNGEARAYPLSVLNWHEIVNDKIGDEYIAISFCPLCYTGNAFERVIDGEPTEFGVSGYLVNSNLVMYDRKTDSLWEQLTGKAIVGPQIGSKLKKITVSTLPWADWVKQYPDTVVLSTDTGYDRDYTVFPYGDYNTSSNIFFSVENKDDRLFEKELTYGVVLHDKSKAYAISTLEEKFPEGGEFEDDVGGHPVKITWMNGSFIVEDTVTGEEIVPEINFWFAWAAFYPETEVWE